jgi:DNA-binding transcriptional MocR family regulator
MPLAALQRLYGGVARRHPRLLEASSHINMDEPALVRQLVLRSLGWAGPLAADELVITNSCTEALSLCLRAVTSPGDTVAVESPGYYLMLQLLETLGLKALEIPTDPRSGMSIEALDLATRESRVAACLLVANAGNPLGSIMPDENKRRLARLTAERGVAVIEDDIYGDLHFGRERPWPIKAFDTAGNVMLCASFSKSLSPALRIGFVAAGRYRSQVALQKTITSGGTNPLTQVVLAEYLESGACQRHLHGLRRSYERQVAAMRAAVARHFPVATRITEPQGGFVLWVELPEEVDTTALHDRAIAAGVSYVPGELFSASGMYRNCLRLNCGNPHTPDIEDAVRRLGKLMTA